MGYRADDEPFLNLLHMAPLKDPNTGKTLFMCGSQVDVSCMLESVENSENIQELCRLWQGKERLSTEMVERLSLAASRVGKIARDAQKKSAKRSFVNLPDRCNPQSK